MRGYDHAAIEKAAQEKWEREALYETDLANSEKDPYYLLFEFPYPSGDLHIGHWYAFALTDIYARYLRMQGKNVLFPIGFDAFGLPAENAAIKNKVDPKEWTYQNMERMRAQIRSMGTSVDWSKEVITCEPTYYKWTQALFNKLFEHGLAERRTAPVKWCPNDQTVLANEQVNDGKCERCGHEVEEKNLTQWFLKITQYAERLLRDLEPLPWREDIKEAQRAWIGESEGAHIHFPLSFTKYPEHNEWRDQDGNPARITVFTTRPDTIFGATYLVLAPEHPWVRAIWDTPHDDVIENKEEVEKYIEATKKKTERERQENKEKTGVRLNGVMAINPATGEEIPVFVADYVLASYGTGAVMAVPAHDERDFEFATKYNLPIRQVVIPRAIDAHNPHVEGKEVVFRRGSISVIHDPKTEKYLCLKWKHADWTTFITGGAEGNEDVVAASLREIHEETGYKNLKLIANLGVTQSEFFASHKDLNRVGHTTTLLFELTDDTQDPIDPEEVAKHELVWMTREEIERAGLQHAEFDIIWRRITNGMDAYTGDGILTESGAFDGRPNREAMWEIVEVMGGERVKNYRIRDWLVSRQRYWGCPIPIVYDPEGTAHPIPQEHLPWLLPSDVDFSPTGVSPLATSTELKERVTNIFGEGWTPEYDTLDTFVDSSWYYLRYLDPNDDHDFSDASLMKKWLPVNRYSGGSEHTTMHLLYARFFHKALYDLALVPTPEPFHERFNRGLILGPDGAKMSKSKGNVINPDDFVQKYGSDAVRMYLAFIGPYNEPGSYPWNLDGVVAMRRFLDRIYVLRERLVERAIDESERKAIGKAAGKVGNDTERFKLNTAVSGLMVCVKELEGMEAVSKEAYGELLKMLAPFAPHLAEHLMGGLGADASVHQATWPEVYVEEAGSMVTLAVQVNGKRRGEITIAPDADEETAVSRALAVGTVGKALGPAGPSKVIYVPGRVLNLVGEKS